MYLEALKIFCDVVRQRSFSRAAAVNRITQSAASQNVLQLEKSLGVRLIDRSKRPLQLTPEGQVYFEGCKPLVERYYALEAEVKSLSQEVSGSVSVAAIYSVGLGDMSRYLQQFARLYPRAGVRLAYLHPHRVYESVVNEDADIGLISYPTHRRGLQSVSWRDELMCVVCGPKHPLASKCQLTGGDLDGQSFTAFDEALIIRREIDRQLRKYRCEPKVVMAFDNIETIKRAVEIGDTLAILPEITVGNEVRAGVLVAIPLSAPTLVRPMGIIYRRGGELPKTVRMFINLIRGIDQIGSGDMTSTAGSSGQGGGGNPRTQEAKVTVGA